MARTATSKISTRKSTGSTRRSSHYNRWTKGEVRELRQFARANMPMREIGRRLGRTEVSIRGKAQREGISLKSGGNTGYARRLRRKR